MLIHLRTSGAKVNPAIVIGTATGILIKAGRASELIQNGGALDLSFAWARKILTYHLGWTKRSATTDRKLTEEEKREAAKHHANLEGKMKNYHPALIFEFDETLAPYCPMDKNTYAPEGARTVQMHGKNDKRGETLTIVITRYGEVLPFAPIWTGLTERTIPKGPTPVGWINSFAGMTGKSILGNGKEKKKTNKWQNRKTMKELLKGLVKPYLDFLRNDVTFVAEAQQYPCKLRGLWIGDHHWSHEDPSVLEICQSLELDMDWVSEGATDLFSALDVGVNKPVKEVIKSCFVEYCAKNVVQQLEAGQNPLQITIDTRLSVFKPLALQWMVNAYTHLCQQPHIISNAWKQVCNNIQVINPIFEDTFTSLSRRKYVSECFCIARKQEIVEAQRQAREGQPNTAQQRGQTQNIGIFFKINKNLIVTSFLVGATQPTPFIGMQIEVFWTEEDGERWEKGKVTSQTSDTEFTVRYEFLEDTEDPEIFEDLLGPTAAVWRALPSP